MKTTFLRTIAPADTTELAKNAVNIMSKGTASRNTPILSCRIPVIKELVKKAYWIFKINQKDFYSDCRLKEFALARKWVCQQLNDTTDLSYVQIGRAIHFDHTTVMYSCRQESRLAVAEYLQGGSPLIPIKRMNYQTGEISIDYIPEKKQKWIKIN